eukprot:scaffold233784_cov18-Prasinocladus_malaysianus.AAC.1
MTFNFELAWHGMASFKRPKSMYHVSCVTGNGCQSSRRQQSVSEWPPFFEVNLPQPVQTEVVDVCSDIKSYLRSKPVVVCVTNLATFGHAGCAL